MKTYIKLRKPIVVFSIFVFSFIFSLTNNTYAYVTFDNHYRTSGVYYKTYYIDASASKYASYIDNAFYNWNDTPTPVYFKKTSDKATSSIEIYYEDRFSYWSGIVAKTYSYKDGIEVNPYYTNWKWNKIVLDKGNFAQDYSLLDLNDYDRLGTATHEIGHAFGLTHNNNTKSIMCTLDDGRTVNKPDNDSINGVNYLY